MLPELSPLPMFPGVGVAVTVGEGVCMGVAVAVGVGVGVETGPRSTTESTGAGSAGSATSWTEEPAGTSTVSSTLWPLVSFTDRRWSSAEAEVTTTAYRAAAASAMSSVRRLMCGCENPPSQYRRERSPMRRLPRACGVAAPYWLIVACSICATDKGAS